MRHRPGGRRSPASSSQRGHQIGMRFVRGAATLLRQRALPRSDRGQQAFGRIQISGRQCVTRLLLEGRDLGMVIPLLLQCIPHRGEPADQLVESAGDRRPLGARQPDGDKQLRPRLRAARDILPSSPRSLAGTMP